MRMTFQSTLPTRGSDMPLQDKAKNDIVFQSTLPTRGSANREAVTTANTSISIHAPHEGERHLCGFSLILCNYNFNPRSPRGGATPPSNIKGNSHSPFQSTLPTRGSDLHGFITINNNFMISIHAPRKGERLINF